MMKLWLTVLALFALVLAQPESDTEGWSTLNLEGGMVLSWLVNGDSVSFSILAPTEGWVALGFGGGPAMKDASLIMGYVDDQGEHCSDQHGTSPFSHSPDTDLGGQDDFTGASVVEEDGTTTLSFTLPREPADSLDPELVPGEPIRILAAYGDRDAFSGMHREAHSAEIEL